METSEYKPLFGGGNGFVLSFEKPLAKIEQQIQELIVLQERTGRDHSEEIAAQRALLLRSFKKTYAKLSPWETVQVARHPNRPLLPDYLELIVRDFCELHGDRNFRDDRAIVTGFGRIGRHKVMIVGHNKGRNTKERITNCFGMAHPEGYRKALLKMKLAAKFRVPVVCLIDTSGAYPGVGAEERGIAQAIAVNLMDMARLPTPIVCVVVGEGGSGGALGIGVGDRVAMLEHAWYSVISPEGCAAILWKSGEYAADAAQALKLTSRHLSDLGLVDDVIPEPLGGAHRNREATVTAVRDYIVESLNSLKRLKTDTLLNRRYKRLRNLGACFERAEARAAQTPPRAGRPAAVKLPAKTARAPSAATQQSDAVAAPLARANR